MEMLTVAEFSPSFSRMSAGALAFAVQHGAAKVDEFISAESINNLKDQGLTTIPSLLIKRAPELATYFDILGIDDDDYERIRADARDVSVNGTPIHTDSNIGYGMSLLLPTSGKKAVFGAGNARFNPQEMPEYVVEYGVGDAIIVRQALLSVNGMKVGHKKAPHIGVGTDPRGIVTIDFHAADISFETASAA